MQRPGLPSDVPGAYAVSEGKPVEVHIHLQGDPDNPGPVAKRTVPTFLEGLLPFPSPRTAAAGCNWPNG